MRAMVTTGPGDYDVMRLEEVPVPSLGPREVLVRNHASGVCYHDHLIRAGVMNLLSTTSTSRTQLAGVIDLVRRRLLRPMVTERFALAEAPRVHRLMVERKLSGRVLLIP